jgi:hypothetical protein
MNEWKDASIRDLVGELDLDARNWVVVDHWEADQCAISIASRRDPRRLVYVSSDGKQPRRFAYQCEVPSGPEETDYRTVDAAHDVSVPELIAVLERHLGSDT